jgi:hypothetical protein
MKEVTVIDKFIEEKVLPKYQPIVIEFRRFIKNNYPLLQEQMRGGTEKYYSVPVYRNKRIVITLSPTKEGITFSFSDGKLFEDKFNLLEGVGNKTLNLRMKDIAEFDESKMKYYIDQGIAIDNRKK